MTQKIISSNPDIVTLATVTSWALDFKSIPDIPFMRNLLRFGSKPLTTEEVHELVNI